ncbi:unnamed protein product [Medioppia subpectinata]|uniref:Uncharacterized protein n=1 Tax=Medioppia subpectinata TaxID=1979941 RepID=A0A7R9L2P6_9ACAR|nr:unnamed protein product [Medioppia subpectinata]CAG2113229.1 unnamed protein product [Medioppia subpectinata]
MDSCCYDYAVNVVFIEFALPINRFGQTLDAVDPQRRQYLGRRFHRCLKRRDYHQWRRML